MLATDSKDPGDRIVNGVAQRFTSPGGSVLGGTGGRPYVRFTIVTSDGKASFAATMTGEGRDRLVDIVSKSDDGVMKSAMDTTTLSDSGLTIRFRRGATKNYTDATLTATSAAGTKVTLLESRWSQKSFTTRIELGNDGDSDSPDAHSVVVPLLSNGDGDVRYNGTVLCQVYGDGKAPMTKAAETPQPPFGNLCNDYVVCHQCVSTTQVESRCMWCNSASAGSVVGQCVPQSNTTTCASDLPTKVDAFMQDNCPLPATTQPNGGECGASCAPVQMIECPSGKVFVSGNKDKCGCDTGMCLMRLVPPSSTASTSSFTYVLLLLILSISVMNLFSLRN